MLKEALKKLSDTRTAATTEVFPDPRTRAGWEMKRRQAQADLPSAKAEFDRAFKRAAFPVFVMGPGTEDFLKLAPQVTESVVLTGLFSELRAAVKATVGRNREFGVSAFTAMLRELRQIGVALGLTSIPDVKFEDVEYVADDAAVDAIIDRYVKTYLGPEFFAAAIEREACLKGEALEGETPVVPVYIAGVSSDATEAMTPRLFGGKAITVHIDTDTAITEELVVSVLQTIKSNLKQ